MPRSASELSYYFNVIRIIYASFGTRIILYHNWNFLSRSASALPYSFENRKLPMPRSAPEFVNHYINQTTFRNYRSAYALQILGEIIKYSKCKCVLPTCRVQQFSMAHCSFTLQKRRPAVGQGSPPRPPHLNYHRGWPAPAFHQLLFFLCRTVVLQGYSMLAGRFSDA